MESTENIISEGLYLDCVESEQPMGTSRFVLNGVDETDEGENNKVSTENSNEPSVYLPLNHVLLGKVYIGNDQNLIFTVSKDETISEIGIVDNYNNYNSLLRADLGFKIVNQISARYRLRRGCERTIYWVDPIPRYFNIDKPEDFKDASGNWDKELFSLFRTYNDVPIIEKAEILENGNAAPGSYNISLQYLDNDLNPTEFIMSTDVVNIYNDNTTKDFGTIRGSTSLVAIHHDFGKTNKAIKFTFNNFDSKYPFYRVAIIKATAGTGQVTEVLFTEEISTAINTYTYSGNDNALLKGTELDVKIFNNVIESASHIEQIENRLVLLDTKGKQVNFCALQKYASKIKADLTTKEIILNDVSESNSKSPTVHLEGIGYMPGEIYSFGIVYVFKGGFVSPAYHIPGKALSYNSLMSSDNECEDSFYIDTNSCGSNGYWGLDSQGDFLVNKRVRHHRFPLRSEVNKPLFTEEVLTSGTVTVNKLRLTIGGTLVGTPTENIEYIVQYSIGGNISTYESIVNVATYSSTSGITLDVASNIGTITVVNIFENGVIVSGTSPAGLNYSTQIVTEQNEVSNKLIKSEIFGIRFSNIQLPSFEELNGEQIVGYYIVRNERTEEDKTILDTGVLTPMLTHEDYVAHGYIMPTVTPDRIKGDVVSLIHPEHKFFDKEYKNINKIIWEGSYNLVSREVSNTITEDVMTGTSYDPEVSRKRESDNDGFDLNSVVRDNRVSYQVRSGTVFAQGNEIKETFYLSSLSSKVISDSIDAKKEIFNVSCDNKIGVIQLDKQYAKQSMTTSLPYVILKRELGNPYSNFRVLPYYKDSKNLRRFLSTVEEVSEFGGDTYITPMRYVSTTYYDTRLKSRATKSGIFNAVIGVLAVIAGAVLIATGVGIAAGIMVIGFGISQVATGLKKEQLGRVYDELYEAGLRETVKDNTTNTFFGPNPVDDQVQWLGDIVSDLWFESSINMSLRHGATANITDFLDSPFVGNVSDKNELNAYLVSKLTVLDTDNSNGRLYQGFANAELYQLNPDFLRVNKQKSFQHLGIEYDCCSDCRESFPHRFAWSEPSFQEELTDNYRTFLPNNYKDIEGSTGRITDVFTIQSTLFIHTEEALWRVPKNIQERITGEIVSFIGTGDYFSLEPSKVLDDEQSSAGTRHNWGSLKTKYGRIFICESESKIYQFDGNSLKPISDNGMSSWFKANLKFNAQNNYYSSNRRNYVYANNPSNLYGTGFVTVYDTRKERIIITKKDFILSDFLNSIQDYELNYYQDNMYLFRDYQYYINSYNSQGFVYLGMINNRMTFSRVTATLVLGVKQLVTEYRYVDGTVITDIIKADVSWTISYSLKKKCWRSWHSYNPSAYIQFQDDFYSYYDDDNYLYKHNVLNSYQVFKGVRYPHIVEKSFTTKEMQDVVWDNVKIDVTARKYDVSRNSFYEDRFGFYNKMIAYNSRQCSGLINLKVKSEEETIDFMSNQIKDYLDSITVDRTENFWSLNDIRDYVVNYNQSFFKKDVVSLNLVAGYIDKVINENCINYNKDWDELESFRDKYLIIRFIFDNFDNVKLITNLSSTSITPSFR